MRFAKNLGIVLAGFWFVATGLISLIGLNFSGLGSLMALLAVAAGVLMIIGR